MNKPARDRRGLRRHGIDATTSTEAGLLRAPDEDHLAFGLAHGRVVFTKDEDDLVLAARGVRHAGIAYRHQQTGSIGEIINALVLIWEVLEPQEMLDRVEYL
jgi:hypothetical protein